MPSIKGYYFLKLRKVNNNITNTAKKSALKLKILVQYKNAIGQSTEVLNIS